jgi:Ser-tRNA(Ala) deacylase AlaX
MTQRRDKHGMLAHGGPGQPTTPTQAAVAASDKDHHGKLVLDEDIRLCAYWKWEAAGKPTGDGVQFWLEAEQELVHATHEKYVQRGGWHRYREHERPEPEKAVKVRVDTHYRDDNRMFQRHGERGHRHGGSS